MSQSGSLIFFTSTAPNDPRASIRALAAYLNPVCIPIVARSFAEEHSWQNFQADLDDPSDEPLPSLSGATGLDQYYRSGFRLLGALDGSSMGLIIGRAVERQISNEIRGNYAPWDPWIRVGWHDLWECAEHDEGLFIARAFLSVAFFGYSTPNDWQAFRRAVFDLPEVRSTKADLERIVGQPLEHVIYWSV
jgi:hypothetical protein